MLLLGNHDLWNGPNKRAFLMTPREDFVLGPNLPRAYDNAFLDISYGVTISGPHLVGRMTSSIDLQKGEKVLEIGTGSGYQSAYLSNLTDKVWTIEIIKPLFERTGGIYDDLIAHGYTEYLAITRKNDDGYYGWQEFAPFDKIIVTCGIDHVPPPLLQQLKPNGIMVIPVGPPGAQHVLKIVKEAVGRQLPRCPLGHLQWPYRAIRAVHQAGQRRDRGHAQWQLSCHRDCLPSIPLGASRSRGRTPVTGMAHKGLAGNIGVTRTAQSPACALALATFWRLHGTCRRERELLLWP